jgi:tetratricopeptide (TPR) repeat protein
MSIDADLLSTGIQFHQAGRLEEALSIYRQALAGDPQNATALSLLGAACINLKRWDEAAEHLHAAVRIDPKHPSAYDNLGVLLAKQNRMPEAVAAFRRAAELSPSNPQTHLNLAAALERNSDAGGAIESYRQAAHLAPMSLKANAEAAKLLQASGRMTEAIPYLRQVARLKSNDPEVRFELAAALALAGQGADAIAAYQEVLQLKPDSAEACVNLAQLFVDKRDFEQAAAYARRAIAMRPLFAEAHLNLGSALSGLERNDEAKASLAECMRLKPELGQAYNNLGNILADELKFAEAEAAYQRSLALNPHSAQVLYNIGIMRFRTGDIASAIEHFDRSLALAPNYAEAHHNRASALLLLGNFSDGLPEYEWRFGSRDFPPFRPRWPLWDGSDPAGKTIVLVAEQGLGDTLQFVRYARLLEARGATVIVECNPVLHPILSRTSGVSQWIGPRDTPPGVDACLPLLSMPHRLRTTLDTIPAEIPYIYADSQRTEAWREEIRAAGQIRVGISWQGNPLAPYDNERSIPLTNFEPLARIPGVRLINLQKGAGSEQLAAVGSAWNVLDLGDRLDASGGAFMDTAAIMQHLDLVITSDTAMSHVAGALGVPTWVALAKVPDWRWLLDREDCPWYPSMRLFRQPTAGDWRSVFERMAGELSRQFAT